MQALKDIITGICLSLMAAGLLRMLSPENGPGKLLKVVISLFVLCAVILPVSGGIDFDFGINAEGAPAEAAENLSEILISQREQLAADGIKDQIEFVLAKYGIQHEGSISVEMIRLEDGASEIGEIVVYLPEEFKDKYFDIVSGIKSELGLDVVIHN